MVEIGGIMDWDSLREGGIGGFVGAILMAIAGALGFHWRLKRLEKISQTKETCNEKHNNLDGVLLELKNAIKDVQTKQVCNEKHIAVDGVLKEVRENQKYIRDKMDELISWHIVNGRHRE